LIKRLKPVEELSRIKESIGLCNSLMETRKWCLSLWISAAKRRVIWLCLKSGIVAPPKVKFKEKDSKNKSKSTKKQPVVAIIRDEVEFSTNPQVFHSPLLQTPTPLLLLLLL